MNDDELKQRLNQLRVPPPADGAKERAWHRADLAFKGGAQEPVTASARLGWRRIAVAIAAGVVLVASFVLGRWSGNPAPSADLRLLAELQRLFPNQLQAVIRTGDQTEILTSPEAITFSDQPLLVELREGGQRVRIVSFSGQRITAKLAGRSVTMEFLITPEGAILIAGDTFVWRSDGPQTGPGFKIEARKLIATL